MRIVSVFYKQDCTDYVMLSSMNKNQNCVQIIVWTNKNCLPICSISLFFQTQQLNTYKYARTSIYTDAVYWTFNFGNCYQNVYRAMYDYLEKQPPYWLIILHIAKVQSFIHIQ